MFGLLPLPNGLSSQLQLMDRYQLVVFQSVTMQHQYAGFLIFGSSSDSQLQGFADCISQDGRTILSGGDNGGTGKTGAVYVIMDL